MVTYFSQLLQFILLLHKFLLALFLAFLAFVFFGACESPEPWPADDFGGGTPPPYDGITGVGVGGSGGAPLVSGSGGIPSGSGGSLSGSEGTAGESSVPAEPRCGDGVAVAPESCDGNDLRGVTCEQLNAGTGQPRCLPSCKFDVSTCSKYDNGATGGISGSSGTGGASGTIGNSGTGGVDTPPLVCTPNTTETEACSECPDKNRTRQCLADGSDWDLWSECDCGPDLPPGCEGQSQAPTWDNSVGAIFQSSCARCHRQAGSYSSFVSWRGGSTSWDATWTQGLGIHALPPDSLAVYNCWVAMGLPEN